MRRRSLPLAAALALLGLIFASCASGVPGPIPCRPAFEIPAREPGVAYLDFIAAGDTGSGDANQAAVAIAMAAYAAANPTSFALLLGDNFYETGVSSTSDPQWQSKFELMYDAGALPFEFYAVLGNHDTRQDPLAQVAYTSLSSRWRMPARYYAVPRVSLSDGTTIDLFGIDTNTFAGESAQIAWLDSALAASGADWKIVFGHHAVYSNGSHGDDAGLIAKLAPMLSARGVDLYLAGHDHDLQVLQPVGGVRYLVDGAGSRLRDTACRANTVYAASRLGFMGVRISRHAMVVQVVLEGGVTDYAFTTVKP